LLKIRESLDFTGDTRSICFTDMAELPQAASGIAVGYGSTDDSKQNKYSDVLRQVDMPIVSQEECFDSDPDYFGRHLFEGNFCSGEIGVMKGVCSGKRAEP
jgi:predicted Ser/Thr protein kinase